MERYVLTVDSACIIPVFFREHGCSCREHRLCPTSLRKQGQCSQQFILADSGPLLNVKVHQQAIEPVPETGTKSIEVPRMVPIQRFGIESAKPVPLKGPEARMTRDDLDIRLWLRKIVVRSSVPGGAACDLLKPQVFVQFDRAWVIFTNVKPDGRRIPGAGLLHDAFGERFSNSASTEIGVGRHVRNEVDTFAMIAEGDQAGVAHNTTLLLPNITRERQGRSLGHVRGPVQKAVITA